MRSRFLAVFLVALALAAASTHLRHLLPGAPALAGGVAAANTVVGAGQAACSASPPAGVRAATGFEPGPVRWCAVMAAPPAEPESIVLAVVAAMLGVAGAVPASDRLARRPDPPSPRDARRRALLQVYLT